MPRWAGVALGVMAVLVAIIAAVYLVKEVF